MKRRIVDDEHVRTVLDYNKDSGVLTWKRRESAPTQWNVRYAGTVAGSPLTSKSNSYIVIRIDGNAYYAHILAFQIVEGRMPVDVVDHIDGNGSNNAWANLREATQSQNIANSIPRTNTVSGLKGAHWDASRKKWSSAITVNRKALYLGRFNTAEEAHQAYCKKAVELYGAFARMS